MPQHMVVYCGNQKPAGMRRPDPARTNVAQNFNQNKSCGILKNNYPTQILHRLNLLEIRESLYFLW